MVKLLMNCKEFGSVRGLIVILSGSVLGGTKEELETPQSYAVTLPGRLVTGL